MLSNPAQPETANPGRPVVSEVQHGPLGREFTVRFLPGDALPNHRNAAKVVITAVEGSGEITVAGEGVRELPSGAVVQLEPNVEHSVVAGPLGLELMVRLVTPCCEHC